MKIRVTTKVLPATNTLGQRIAATHGSLRVVFPRDYGVSVEAQRLRVAQTVAHAVYPDAVRGIEWQAARGKRVHEFEIEEG